MKKEKYEQKREGPNVKGPNMLRERTPDGDTPPDLDRATYRTVQRCKESCKFTRGYTRQGAREGVRSQRTRSERERSQREHVRRKQRKSEM